MCKSGVSEGAGRLQKHILSGGWIDAELKDVFHPPSAQTNTICPEAHLLRLQTKWPYVTTLRVPLPFLLRHLSGNERRNGRLLPSRRTQICVPVRFKHLLRPHLAESVLCWTAMWFPGPRAPGCRQTQRKQHCITKSSQAFLSTLHWLWDREIY